MIVFVTDELPRPGAAGHLAMNHAIIDWLQSQGHEIILLLVGARLVWPVERYATPRVAGPAVWKLGAYVAARTPRAHLKILAKAGYRLLPKPVRLWARAKKNNGADAVLGSFITPAQSAWCARYIGRLQPSVVLVDTIFRAPLLLEPELAGINSLIIAHDVFHRRHRALASAGYAVRPAVLSRQDEAGHLNAARGIAAIQPEEAAEIRAMCPERLVVTTPMPATPCPRPAGTSRLADRLIFVGSASLPNLDGLRWFFEQVWPDLRRWRGNRVTLDLVGDCGAALGRLPDGVNRLGRLASLTPALHQASLAIAPLRVGSGLKIKMLDYARHGLLTIATPASLQGFAPDEASPFIPAASPTEFSRQIIRQLDVGTARDYLALAYVARYYGAKASFAGLGTALALAERTTA